MSRPQPSFTRSAAAVLIALGALGACGGPPNGPAGTRAALPSAPPMMVAASAPVVAGEATRTRSWERRGSTGRVWAVGQRIVAIEDGWLQLTEPDGTLIARRQVPESSFVLRDKLSLARSEVFVLVLGDGQHDAAFEVVDTALKTSWKGSLGARVSLLAMRATPDVVLIHARRDSKNVRAPGPVVKELLAFDARSGRALWRRPFLNDVFVASGDSAFLFERLGIEALDLRHGTPRWVAPMTSRIESLFAGADKLLIQEIAAPSPVRVLDVRSGQELDVVQTATPNGMIGADGVVFMREAMGPLPSPSGMPQRIVAIDMTTGKVRWRSVDWTELVLANDPWTPLAVSDEEVLSCSKDGVLRGFDRKTGALRSVFGLGTCTQSLVATRGSNGGATWIYAGVERPERYVSITTAPARARVHGVVSLCGKPFAGAVVRAFDAIASSDADGRYALTAVGTGKLVVSALAKLDPPTTSTACAVPFATTLSKPVEMGRSSEHVVDLSLDDNRCPSTWCR